MDKTLYNQTMDMFEALGSPASSINVRNAESDFSRFYHMDVPFQLTLEYCSGSEPNDYINVITLAPNRSILYQETLATKNYTHSKDVMHFHDYFELTVVLKGVIIQKLEGENFSYPAGTACLLNRSTYHLEHYHAPAVVLFIGMSPDFLSELFTFARNSSFQNEKQIFESDFYRFVHTDLKNPGKKAYINFLPAGKKHQCTDHLYALTESIVLTLLYSGFGTAYQLRGLLCSLLNSLFSPEQYHHTLTQLDTDSDFLIFTRISHLFEENDDKMSRSDLEQALSYSSDYLNRIVNKYAGMCLFDYAMTFRLKKAARYLIESKDSISTIAARLHFSNRTHFYTLFRETYGVTPKEYRRTHL